MLSGKIEKMLNDQVNVEAYSSAYYLSMGSWADNNGLPGISSFLYKHSDEERQHMLKLIHFINQRNGKAIISEIQKPKSNFKNVLEVFETVMEHEISVTQSINNIVATCLEEKDFTTYNFMQWYVQEQIEEENLVRTILDKIALIDIENSGYYLLDRDIQDIQVH